ncbi:hypothetical protein Mal64_20140 [Pseudobythopirellula maris]|uniref:DUF5117 domain-containing protein n=2 Tax=Pseudobythopirellula maris TaxID=2527991 RepID=A0A5C5ZP34_9BACT|nr:hypothetical protein Mal64_20140 [Pseudobythopirellula maris]
MRLASLAAAIAIVFSLSAMPAAPAWADEPAAEEGSEPQASASNADEAAEGEASADAGDSKESGKSAAKKPAEPPKFPPASKVLKDTKEIDGLIKLHKSDDHVFAELQPSDLNKDYIVLITIARGMGQTPLVGGFSWNFGDDWVWQFRKVGDRILIVRRNVRFKAKKGSPSEQAVKLAYTDSVLYSLPIKSRKGSSYIVDLTPVFFSDLPQISQVLSGFNFSTTKSTWSEVEGFPKNVELEVAATYTSGGYRSFDSVPDSRGVTLNVHYSISRLPTNGYKPRLADDRIGYFVTALKDYSKPEDEDRFVRYVNRWNLEKADPSADVSTPKEPIKFWLDKTIPFKYRKPIRDGITEWNKAFEKAGFYDAINVEQQPNDATWDPGDIRYNTFQWITSGAGFAMGPSRVNPTTGEILDADIIFDADFLQFWKQTHEFFTPKGIEVLTGGPIELGAHREQQRKLPQHLQHGHTGRCSCNLLGGVSQQLAFATAVAATSKRGEEELEKLILQGLKEVTMHEVGHTLGLRHNFKASTLYSIEEMQDEEKVKETGLTASVMDYAPVMLLPESMKQPVYYSQTIGPYDYWAIEYGYKTLKSEEKELKKIAARSGEKGLAFSTDGDTRGIDPDPHSRRFDLSSNLVEYARSQAELVAETMPKIVDELVEEGEGYERARQAFGVLITTHFRVMFDAARYVGGVGVSRSHKGDKDATAPFVPVDAERQREAVELVAEQVFSDKPFDVPASLYNHLAPTNWDHWGTQEIDRPDYPTHKVILLWQQRVLDQLTASLTLERLHDSELKTPADEDAYTSAELFKTLTGAIFSEVGDFEADDSQEFTNRKPFVSGFRRNLQRAYLERLTSIALGRRYISYFSRRDGWIDPAPQDCQTLVFLELKELKRSIDTLLEDEPELDRYSLAHLTETSSRIGKVLEAETLNLPLRSRYIEESSTFGRE